MATGALGNGDLGSVFLEIIANLSIAGKAEVSFALLPLRVQPVWRSGQSVGLAIERSRVRNSLVPSGSSLRQGN